MNKNLTIFCKNNVQNTGKNFKMLLAQIILKGQVCIIDITPHKGSIQDKTLVDQQHKQDQEIHCLINETNKVKGLVIL